MKGNRPSETALKVALTIVSLNCKPGWAERLPPHIAELSERLILSAKAFGYTPGLMRMSKQGWMVALYNGIDRVMPGMFEGFGERKIYMDQQVNRALNLGCSQVLVVGAGFDTLCLRLAPLFPEVSFFEVDHPATAEAKRRGVLDIGQPDNMTLLPADLAVTTLPAVLGADARWNPNKPSVVVMEGLLYYLTRDQVLALFQQVNEVTGDGSAVAFSHMLDERRPGWVEPMLRMIGEPWLSFASADQLPEYVGAGWQITDTSQVSGAGSFEAFALAEKSLSESNE